MSNALAKYVFESNEVRAVLDERGEPWLVAADVARALEYRDAHSLTRSLPDDEKGTHAVSTLGGIQSVGVISEPGLYRAVFMSRAEKAEAFRRWVAHEVLPSIRRTGAYTVQAQAPSLSPEQRSVRVHMETAKALAEAIPGLSIGIAASVALDAIRKDTGVDMEAHRALLPAASGPVANLNATAVGKALGLPAKKANELLAARGFQRKRDKGGWEVTEEGAKYGEMRPFTRNGHSDYQPLWRNDVLAELASK